MHAHHSQTAIKIDGVEPGYNYTLGLHRNGHVHNNATFSGFCLSGKL